MYVFGENSSDSSCGLSFNDDYIALSNGHDTKGVPVNRLYETHVNHGLGSAEDLEQFLKSPEGKKVIAAVSQILFAEQAAQKRQLLMSFEQQEMAKAMILLDILHDEERAESQFERASLEQQHARQESMQQAQQAAQMSSQINELDNKIVSYDTQLQSLNNESMSLSDELSQLFEKITENKQEKEAIKQRYDNLDNKLEQTQSFAPQKINDEEEIKAIEGEIAKLEKTIERGNEQVIALIDEGKEDEARQLMNDLNANNAQVANLKDMLDVAKGKKALLTVNEQGDLESTNDFNDAKFIYQPDTQKIVKDGDNFYLLERESKEHDFPEFDDLSPDEKQRAQFSLEKNSIRVVPNELADNRDRENLRNDANFEQLQHKQQQIEAKVESLSERIQKLQQEKAQAVEQRDELKQQLEQLEKPVNGPDQSHKSSHTYDFSLEPMGNDSQSYARQHTSGKAI